MRTQKVKIVNGFVVFLSMNVDTTNIDKKNNSHMLCHFGIGSTNLYLLAYKIINSLWMYIRLIM